MSKVLLIVRGLIIKGLNVGELIVCETIMVYVFSLHL